MSSNGKAKARKADPKKKKDTKNAPPEVTPPSSPASTPSSPRSDTLKIKIKLGHAPAPPLLRILPAEAFLEFRGYLAPFLQHPNNAEWTETELRNLRTHIEAARVSINEICEGAGKQADALDAWRAAASPKRKAEEKPKGKKAKRVHEDYKIGKDYDGDSAYSDMGSEDDDVDVDGEGDVDVVAIDSADEPAKSEGRGGNGKRGGNSKMANMIRRRGSRRQRLMKSKAAGGRKTSPTSPSSPAFEDQEAGTFENEFGEEEAEDTAAAAVHLGPSAFWTTLEAYFRQITESDLQYITPKPENPDDAAFRIPPLGSHYLQVWSNEDGEEKKLIGSVNAARPSTRMSSTRGFGSDDEDEDPVIGDLTRRLLATLLEENLVVPRSSSPTLPSSSLDDEEELLGNPAISTLNYSRQAMFSLEERIRMELRSIGLLDEDEMSLSEREDDEVCTEIRRLHQVLREQMTTNNDKKLKLLAIARPKMQEQEAERKQKLQNTQTEKSFAKMMAKKKKRGGRRPTTLPVSFPEYAEQQ